MQRAEPVLSLLNTSVPNDLLRLALLEDNALGGDDDSLAGAQDLGDRIEEEAWKYHKAPSTKPSKAYRVSFAR